MTRTPKAPGSPPAGDPGSPDLEEGWSALEEGDFDEALATGLAFLKEHPTDGEANFLAGAAHLQKRNTPRAERFLRAAVLADPGFPDAHEWLGLALERLGRFAECDGELAKAHNLDSENFRVPVRLSRLEFEKAVEEAIGRLPDEFRNAMSNLSVQVDDLPDDALLSQMEESGDETDLWLLGLFDGVPLPEKSASDIPRGPDRILIFQRNVERECAHAEPGESPQGDRDRLIDEIAITVFHEVGHYLGYDEDDLEELGFG